MSQVEAQPHYDSLDHQQPISSGDDVPRGQIFEENEYGEMKPSATSQPPRDIDGNPIQTGQLASGTVFSENEYGEIREADSTSDKTATIQNPRENLVPNDSMASVNFGKDTEEKSEAFRSNQVYPENRFGELGRADTQSDEGHKVGTADRVKGK